MMERLKRTFTLNKKKPVTLLDKSSKPPQWNDDERKVGEGTCSFQVKYLGSIEVFESRGMPVCEEAMKQLLRYKSKKNAKRAVLYVSGDALRVTEEISKGLIVDQVIEKVSFCAPDRNHHRGFAYICRDAATRRWLCHGFKAVKESGERLSHAVGCAFSVCLERKQQREKDSVDVTFNENKTSFTRLGSFKQASITERLLDPQSVIIPGAPPNGTILTSKPIDDQSSIPRPHASQTVLERQSSLRIFPKLQDQQKNPFKRDYSVRITELSLNHDRKKIWHNEVTIKEESNGVPSKPHDKTPPDNHNSSQFNHTFPSVIQDAPVKSSTANQAEFSPFFENDPFSAAPINPAAHIKHNKNNQTSKQSNFSPTESFKHSLRQTESARPSNLMFQINGTNMDNSKDRMTDNRQPKSVNSKLSTSWSDDILKPAATSSERTAKNVDLCSKTSVSNPFDVSWVKYTTSPNSNTNNSNNPFIC